MYCTSCGASVPPKAHFCTTCGAALSVSGATPSFKVPRAHRRPWPWLALTAIILVVVIVFVVASSGGRSKNPLIGTWNYSGYVYDGTTYSNQRYGKLVFSDRVMNYTLGNGSYSEEYEILDASHISLKDGSRSRMCQFRIEGNTLYIDLDTEADTYIFTRAK